MDDGWMDGWVGGWMNGSISGWVDRDESMVGWLGQ